MLFPTDTSGKVVGVIHKVAKKVLVETMARGSIDKDFTRTGLEMVRQLFPHCSNKTDTALATLCWLYVFPLAFVC